MTDLIERLEKVGPNNVDRGALAKEAITALREQEAEELKDHNEILDRERTIVQLEARIAELESMNNDLSKVINGQTERSIESQAIIEQYEQARIHLENFDRYRKDSDVNAAIDIFNRIRGE